MHTEMEVTEMSNKPQILDITDRIFDEEVLKKDGKIILLLAWNGTGTWCKSMNCELLDAIEDERLAGKVLYRRINLHQSSRVHSHGRVLPPTTLIYKQGQLVKTIYGLQNCEDIVKIVASHLN
jgi:thioredoxin-like negative regulator of GroEL